jgi:demethylmenaquinone methyltransferase/2-methoxy-6-polyprenyl-1,4-benzoquinol methylase
MAENGRFSPFRHYDLLSTWYDALAAVHERKPRTAALRMLDAGAGSRILDIGCGTGAGLRTMERMYPGSGLYGIDISPGMLRVARKKRERSGGLHRVNYIRGDAMLLPFRNESFDAVFFSFTLEIFDTASRKALLSHCRELLTSGGKICVVNITDKQTGGIILRWYRRARARWPQWIDCAPIHSRESLVSSGFRILKHTEMTTAGLPLEINLAIRE